MLNILALGGESEGNFSVYSNDLAKKIYLSPNFNDLLDEENFQKFKKNIFQYLKQKKIKPDIILSDLHPAYKTTFLAEKLAKKYKARHIKIQHHLAHIFSAIGERKIGNWKLEIGNYFGIACDGTGYGWDGKIWGGEIFNVKCQMSNVKCIKRIGHLENQTMIGGELAIKEPARMLISILDKFPISNFQFPNKKEFIFYFVKKFYTRNQFELLYNQLQQNFNCIETSSTARILDAVSILLGFCKNERKYKHEPINLLEKNSINPYNNIKPQITFNSQLSTFNLQTTHLFQYLIKNLHRDKKRLAATAQLYIAKGLYEICQMSSHQNKFGAGQANVKCQMFFAGGLAKNKIISDFLKKKGVIINKTISPGDVSLSFGQIIYYSLTSNCKMPAIQKNLKFKISL